MTGSRGTSTTFVADDGVKGSGGADFVKKLYNMLEDRTHDNVVSWSLAGDSFAVKDMNEFTRSILPNHFKHSNFASFVRQLNKYDFHKVKNPDSTETGIYGDHTWEFQHPHFRANMRDSLELIKRKGPAPKKGSRNINTSNLLTDPSASENLSSAPIPLSGGNLTLDPTDKVALMQQQLDLLAQDQHNLNAHVGNLTRDYHTVTQENMYMRRMTSNQNHIIQRLIQFIANLERKQAGISESDATYPPSPEVHSMMAAFNEIARMTPPEAAHEATQMRQTYMSGRLLPGGRSFVPALELRPGSPTEKSSTDQGSPTSTTQAQTNANTPSMPSLAPPAPQMSLYANNVSDQVLFAQHDKTSMPHTTSSRNTFPGTQSIAISEPGARSMGSGKRSKAPAWSIRPKVLLVEDDLVCRRISSKFLELFGCTIDVAEDGVSAVAKMNSEKYDLVFMDINMPNLDGVSATSLIRQFDPMTPIISMTSASNPSDMVTYFSHGMNDILPKPFTKEGLLEMLEKHLLHLKQMQTLTEIPRALGIPDDAIQSALVSTFNDPSATNPFAELLAEGDGDYVQMLASLINGTGNSNAGLSPMASGLKREAPDSGDEFGIFSNNKKIHL